MRRLITGAAIAVVVAAAGCSAGSEVLPKSEVEQGAKDALTELVGRSPESVTCPDDLDAEVDASMRCTLTDDDGSSLGVTVTVTAIDGDNASYDVEVDSK